MTQIFKNKTIVITGWASGIGKSIPTKEFAKPEEIADAVVFLSSPSAKSIVGVGLVIDGGMTEIIND